MSLLVPFLDRRRRRPHRLLALLPLVAAVAFVAPARAVDILTFHGDQARLGWNASETRLTHASVNNREFGKLWEAVLDGQVYGSPLHLAYTVNGRMRDVVYAATERNSVYALDAADGSVLVFVPGGPFVMGIADGERYEGPPRAVDEKPFFLGKLEVTNAR